MCLKDAALCVEAFLRGLFQKVFVKFASGFGRGRGVKAWPPAPAAVSVEGELRNQQQFVIY